MPRADLLCAYSVCTRFGLDMISNRSFKILKKYRSDPGRFVDTLSHMPMQLHGPSMLVVKAKIYGVLYKQYSSIAFDETSSNWSALKGS